MVFSSLATIISVGTLVPRQSNLSVLFSELIFSEP